MNKGYLWIPHGVSTHIHTLHLEYPRRLEYTVYKWRPSEGSSDVIGSWTNAILTGLPNFLRSVAQASRNTEEVRCFGCEALTSFYEINLYFVHFLFLSVRRRWHRVPHPTHVMSSAARKEEMKGSLQLVKIHLDLTEWRGHQLWLWCLGSVSVGLRNKQCLQR
jgi:hypothetical protein